MTEKSDERIEKLEKRVAELEKMLKLLTSPDENAVMAELLSEASRLAVFDFTVPSYFETSDWQLGAAVKADDVTDKLAFRAEQTRFPHGYDPMIIYDAPLHLDAANARYIHICFEANTSHFPYAKIYFKTAEQDFYSEDKCVGMLCTANTMNDVCFDMRQNPRWNGIITGLRFDPMECSGTAELEKIAIMNDTDAVPLMMFDFTQSEYNYSEEWSLHHAEAVSSTGTLKIAAVPRLVEGFDPRLENNSICVDINNAAYVRLRCKGIPEKPGNPCAQIYFKTKEDDVYSQNKSIGMSYKSGTTVDLYFDMTKNSKWHGTLTGLRADVMESAGTMEVERIEVIANTAPVAMGGFFKSLRQLLRMSADWEDQLDDVQCHTDELDCRIDDLESRIDDLQCSIEDSEA